MTSGSMSVSSWASSGSRPVSVSPMISIPTSNSRTFLDEDDRPNTLPQRPGGSRYSEYATGLGIGSGGEVENISPSTRWRRSGRSPEQLCGGTSCAPPRGESTVEVSIDDQFDMEEIDHGITAISHTALDSGVGDDNGDTPSSGPHSPTVRWASGSCTRIGGKRTNEDRYVAIPDVSATATKPGGIRNETVKVATTWLPGVDLKETSFGSTGALGYFAVYDGHDGEDAAELMSRSLHLRILGHPEFEMGNELERVVSETCLMVDKELLDTYWAKKKHCGTTAIGAFVSQEGCLLVFNIGDCHAVLCRNGQALNLSKAHKPGREDERQRIARANGWIQEE
eukprot:gene4327-5484_t